MKKLMSIAKKASTALAALALVVATTSVPSACFHWFAQPVEPEELKLCKQEIIGNCVLQKGGMKWLRIRF
mgnify:CR=1 FL=1